MDEVFNDNFIHELLTFYFDIIGNIKSLQNKL